MTEIRSDREVTCVSRARESRLHCALVGPSIPVGREIIRHDVAFAHLTTDTDADNQIIPNENLSAYAGLDCNG